MWGYSIQFWQTVVKVALVVAACAGALSIAAGFVAGLLGYRVAEVARVAADRRIAEAQASVGEAKADAARANAETAKANDDAAKLQARTKSLEQEAAASRLEAERLQAQMASPLRSHAQQEKLVSVLRERGDREVEISVRVQGSDPETAQYASELVAVLTAAGLKVHQSMALILDPPPGLSLGAPIDSVDFQLIKRAFDAAGIDLEFAGIVPVLTLYVGPKSLVIE